MAQQSAHRLVPLRRARASFVALALGTIAVGLGLHLRGDILGAVLRDVLGDALWAAMITWWIAAIIPGSSLRARGIAALATCFAVELSQRYHTPALDALRDTTAGHLVLGSGFDPRDFVSYGVGVLVAILLERMVRGRAQSVPQRAAIVGRSSLPPPEIE
jgi:hypothetical protein